LRTRPRSRADLRAPPGRDRKMVRRRKFRGIPALLVAGALILPLLAGAAATEDGDPGTAPAPRVLVARVNGEPIYEDQLAPQVESQLRKFRKRGAKGPSEDLTGRLRQQALDKVIAMELLVQASRDLAVADMDEKVASRMAEMKKGQAMGMGKMSDETARQAVRKQIIVKEYLARNGLSEPQVPETEVREYYDNNKQNFAVRESVQVRHILVKVDPGATPAEKQEAREKIEKARRLVRKGEPFAKVAEKFSQCNSASGGGELAPIERGYMPPEFDAVAFAIEPHKLSDVVETKFGYHILEVNEKTADGTVPPYEKLRDFIGRFLRKEQSRRLIDARIEDLKKSAKIEVFLK